MAVAAASMIQSINKSKLFTLNGKSELSLETSCKIWQKIDRKSVEQGKSVDLGDRRINKNKNPIDYCIWLDTSVKILWILAFGSRHPSKSEGIVAFGSRDPSKS